MTTSDDRACISSAPSTSPRSTSATPPGTDIAGGVLLDMVGDADLQIYHEGNSLRTPQTRQLVHDIWGIARDLGVREFIFRNGHEVRDDHLPSTTSPASPPSTSSTSTTPAPASILWHTTPGHPQKCSALSLAKVGWVARGMVEAEGERVGVRPEA